MSRGGRGGRGRGGRPKGPDVAWDDEPIVPQTTKPEPLFPDIDLPVPKAITEDEIERANAYLSFRDDVRNGPFYTVLEPSSFTDERGKTNPKAGFDPFTGVERYSSRFFKPKRTVPDFSGQQFHLKFFPRELWSTLDPQKKDPIWKTVPPSKTSKRKRPAPPEDEDADDNEKENDEDSPNHESDASDSDAPLTSNRRARPGANAKKQKKKDDPTSRSGQKRGLEAEDDIPDVEQNEEEQEDGDEAPQDSEFDEESDDEGDDYNAENYFDSGEGDDFDDTGGGGGDDVYD